MDAAEAKRVSHIMSIARHTKLDMLWKIANAAKSAHLIKI